LTLILNFDRERQAFEAAEEFANASATVEERPFRAA
jgi:hypothetical protein